MTEYFITLLFNLLWPLGIHPAVPHLIVKSTSYSNAAQTQNASVHRSLRVAFPPMPTCVVKISHGGSGNHHCTSAGLCVSLAVICGVFMLNELLTLRWPTDVSFDLYDMMSLTWTGL